jgi:RNA methyltransferase, TrmH family
VVITSPANERLKQARRVRDGRDPELVFVEGERLIESCLISGLRLAVCFHSSGVTPRAEAIITELHRRECPVFEMPEAVFATVSDTVNPQGIILLAGRPSPNFEDLDDDGVLARVIVETVSAVRSDSARSNARAPLGSPLIVGIDAVQDPGNFGAIIRTAEAAGATGIVAMRGSVDPFAPKTLRGSMGSAFRLPIVTDLEPGKFVDMAHERGLTVVATSADAATLYTDYDWSQPTVVFFGNEGNGIGPELMEQSDQRIRIPLCSPVESLNVAAAAAVVLFEGARQRRAASAN